MVLRHLGPPTAGGRGRGERGETLIELMATVVLMGIAVVAVLTMIFTLIRVSNAYRKTTTANVEAVTFAEDLLQTENGQAYQPCAVPTDYQFTAVDGFEAQVEEVQYLMDNTASSSSWVSTCPATDQGMQRLTVLVSAETSPLESERVTVFKRDRTCSDGSGERC